MLGAFLYPVAKILEVSTGIGITTSIISLGILILIYTAVGGLWAVIVTDVLQFIVLTAAVLIVVPLAFGKIGGIENFVHLAPANFFDLVNNEYTVGFMVAFGFYNLFFIAGNWAYIQRYTSVATPRDAKKVGWLFGALYTISPVIWMLPPMIYKLINPGLAGTASEGAYLLMCKEVLPAGMLGLMLVGMIFATSSSVNTTLNISAGVFTNDIYRHFKPNSDGNSLVKVGKLATAILGIITILVALCVPLFGGIVEVVMTLAALTGGAMFLPPLWSLFSKNQTGTSVLGTTLITLFINAFFKFFGPSLLGLTLNRTQEMMVGVALPIALLTIYELYANWAKNNNAQYEAYLIKQNSEASADEDTTQSAAVENLKGLRVIGFGVLATGFIILSLSLINTPNLMIVTVVGLMVSLLGGLIIYKGFIKAKIN